jgi:hypothetical protein
MNQQARRYHSSITPSIQRSMLCVHECSNLKGTGILQELGKLALDTLEVGVTADVLLLDPDVGNGALTGDLLKGVLDGGSII